LMVRLRQDSQDEESPLPEEWQAALKENLCPTCKGSRLNALASHVTINDLSISDLTYLSIEKAAQFVNAITLEQKEDLTLEQVHKEIKARLQFLQGVGLTDLTLSRRASTLSGGEAERVRLARQIGSGLTGVLYVLDEPTIGLHPEDCEQLVEALRSLKELGNTLLVVEHDPQLIMQADHVVEFGPGSGQEGGKIVATGTPDALKKNPQSLTGKYLDGSRFLAYAKKASKKPESFLAIQHAKVNNLKNLSLEIPIGAFTCLTGVSGSGKSSLMEGIIAHAMQESLKKNSDVVKNKEYTIEGLSQLKQLIWMDQRPIGHTVRSDVATFTDVLTPIRHFFAQLPEAKIKGLQPKNFSAYHRKGMCTN